MPEARLIAIVGAESTGKTWLARELAAHLATATGQRSCWVSEHLRDWCDTHGRTPRPDEQAAIAACQSDRVAEAARHHDWVVCDTTALMTSVYSRYLFGDASLDAQAWAAHAQVHVTLLTALDLPWQADGLQRDGAHVREPVDALLREMLQARSWPYAVVHGEGAARLQAAVDAVGTRLPLQAGAARIATPTSGLFTRWTETSADDATPARSWWCDCCDVPKLERALRAAR